MCRTNKEMFSDFLLWKSKDELSESLKTKYLYTLSEDDFEWFEIQWQGKELLLYLSEKDVSEKIKSQWAGEQLVLRLSENEGFKYCEKREQGEQLEIRLPKRQVLEWFEMYKEEGNQTSFQVPKRYVLSWSGFQYLDYPQIELQYCIWKDFFYSTNRGMNSLKKTEMFCQSIDDLISLYLKMREEAGEDLQNMEKCGEEFREAGYVEQVKKILEMNKFELNGLEERRILQNLIKKNRDIFKREICLNIYVNCVCLLEEKIRNLDDKWSWTTLCTKFLGENHPFFEKYLLDCKIQYTLAFYSIKRIRNLKGYTKKNTENFLKMLVPKLREIKYPYIRNLFLNYFIDGGDENFIYLWNEIDKLDLKIINVEMKNMIVEIFVTIFGMSYITELKLKYLKEIDNKIDKEESNVILILDNLDMNKNLQKMEFTMKSAIKSCFDWVEAIEEEILSDVDITRKGIEFLYL